MNSERHNYEYDVDPSSQTAPANVVRMVGQNKRVLEIGCGPGSITKLLVQQSRCHVTGMELDPSAIKIASQYCESVIQVDLNAQEWPDLLNGAEPFDVVVAADVLEHLYDPWATLCKMVSLIHADGYLVISLPHVGHAAVMSCLINGDFEYRDWGLLDRTHIRFFGLKNIEDLFSQAGLKIIEVKYVVMPPEETEFSASWSKLSVQVQNALRSCPHADVYQVVVKAVPLSSIGDSLALIPPRAIRNSAITSIPSRARIGAYLSPRLKRIIRKGLHSLGVRI